MACYILAIGYTLSGQVIYGLMFLELDSNSCSNCKQLNNWTTQIDLANASALQTAFLNSAFLIAQAVAYVVVPLFVSKYGPKRTWLLLQY